MQHSAHALAREADKLIKAEKAAGEAMGTSGQDFRLNFARALRMKNGSLGSPGITKRTRKDAEEQGSGRR